MAIKDLLVDLLVFPDYQKLISVFKDYAPFTFMPSDKPSGYVTATDGVETPYYHLDGDNKADIKDRKLLIRCGGNCEAYNDRNLTVYRDIAPEGHFFQTCDLRFINYRGREHKLDGTNVRPNSFDELASDVIAHVKLAVEQGTSQAI